MKFGNLFLICFITLLSDGVLLKSIAAKIDSAATTSARQGREGERANIPDDVIQMLELLKKQRRNLAQEKTDNDYDEEDDIKDRNSIVEVTDIMQRFKFEHDLKPNSTIDLQLINTIDNTITANGILYSLDRLKRVGVLSKDATCIINGIDISYDCTTNRQSQTYSLQQNNDTNDETTTIVVTKNPKTGSIKTVEIMNQKDDVYMASLANNILGTIKPKDFDPNLTIDLNADIADGKEEGSYSEAVESGIREKLKNIADTFIPYLFAGEGGEGGERGQGGEGGQGNVRRRTSSIDITNNKDKSNANGRLLQKDGSCSSYAIVELAIAFDAPFCSKEGGYKQATAMAQDIVARASIEYEKLCLKLEISHMEGWCDSKADPYSKLSTNKMNRKMGCGRSTGMFPAFIEFWAHNRKGVKRDTAHLFTNRPYGAAKGCAKISALCEKDRSYGINSFRFSTDLRRRAYLFAHEFGHNLGMEHSDAIGCGGLRCIMKGQPSGKMHAWHGSAKEDVDWAVENFGKCLHFSETNMVVSTSTEGDDNNSNNGNNEPVGDETESVSISTGEDDNNSNNGNDKRVGDETKVTSTPAEENNEPKGDNTEAGSTSTKENGDYSSNGNNKPIGDEIEAAAKGLLVIDFDEHPSEFRWEIRKQKDNISARTRRLVPVGIAPINKDEYFIAGRDYGFYVDEESAMENFTLERGEKYEFIVMDLSENGICCAGIGGGFKLTVDDITVAEGGKFREPQSYTFLVPFKD